MVNWLLLATLVLLLAVNVSTVTSVTVRLRAVFLRITVSSRNLRMIGDVLLDSRLPDVDASKNPYDSSYDNLVQRQPTTKYFPHTLTTEHGHRHDLLGVQAE